MTRQSRVPVSSQNRVNDERARLQAFWLIDDAWEAA
jgi:hypothetical protein